MRIRQAFTVAAILLVPLVVAVAAALLIKIYLFEAFAVPSASMEPTLTAGDHIFVSKLPLPNSRPDHGDVVVFRLDDPAQTFFVKRVVALPGDCVEIVAGRVRLNGHTLAEPYLADNFTPGHSEPEIVPQNSVYVLGDNRANSLDSRVRGFIPVDAIIGRARLIYWSAGKPTSLPRALAQSSGESQGDAQSVRWERILRPVN